MMIGMSQERLGSELGLTFQQIQKYEKGLNRIGASRLYALSRILDVPIQYFFDEMPSELNSESDLSSDQRIDADALLTTPESVQLSIAFSQIKDASTRRRLSELVRSLADEV